MILTDQPGRFLAIFVFAPLIYYKGHIHKDVFLKIFGALLFFWDAYWLLFREPKKSTLH